MSESVREPIAYNCDEKFVAKYFSVSIETVRGWRKRKIGPQYVKLSGHLIRYRVQDLADWADAQRGNAA